MDGLSTSPTEIYRKVSPGVGEPTVERLGGRSNTVFRIRERGTVCYVKYYKVDERRRFERELAALDHLEVSRPGIAPVVLYGHFDGHAAVAVLSEVPGDNLAGRYLDDSQLSALRQATKAMHGSIGCCSAEIGAVVSPPLHLFARVDTGIGALPGRPAIQDIWLECRNTLRHTLESMPQESVVFDRGDPNLENCLWDGEEVRFVDFEYAGLSSRPFELAHLVGHVNSRGTPVERWLAFVDGFGLSDAEWAYFRCCRVLVEAFWSWHATLGSWGTDTSKKVSVERFSAVLKGL